MAFDLDLGFAHTGQVIVDPNGNNNGELDAGETVQLAVALHNTGGDDAPDVKATLSSSNYYVQILDANGSYGTVAAGGTASNDADPFTVKTGLGLPPGTDVTFNLHVTSADESFDIPFTIRTHIVGGIGEGRRMASTFLCVLPGLVKYGLSRTAKAKLAVYNPAGQLVRVLANGTFAAGEYTATFTGGGGLYFVRLVTDEMTLTRKLMVME